LKVNVAHDEAYALAGNESEDETTSKAGVPVESVLSTPVEVDVKAAEWGEQTCERKEPGGGFPGERGVREAANECAVERDVSEVGEAAQP
jgi:hypothetical protein